MKKQMFLALILLCAGISLNAMTNDMENQEETKTEEAAPAIPAPVKKEVTPSSEEALPAVVTPKEEETEEDFEIDFSDEEIEE